MYIVSFHQIFNENASALSQRLGVPVVQDMNPKPNDIVIVFGAHECPDKLIAIQAAIPLHYIIIQSEQFYGKAFDNKFYVQLVKDNVILDFSKENVRRLKQHLPTPVYSLYFYDFFQTESPKFEDLTIDFFFCGAPTPERERAIREFKAVNPEYVYEIDFSYSYVNPILLNEKLKQVKYVLNIPFYKENALETHRINRAISLGCQVVSLPSSDREMNIKYEPYIHIVPKLTDFSLLFELEPKKTYLQLMEEFGIYQIQSNVNGIRHAEKKLNKKNALIG
jgi:hypothetical protein